MKFLRLLVCLTLLVYISGPAVAQEFRATISGRVTDSSGAIIPNAAVTVTDTDTGTKTDTVTNASGEYTVPFLLPGKYSVVVNVKGFQRYVHDGITVQSGEKIAEDALMTVGAETEVVRVTTDAPLLETASSTAGQVLTPEEIADLPDNGRSPLALAKTEFAVIPKLKNSVVQARPFDNSAASDFSVGGGASQSNEYLLDGIPNMQSSSRLPGFSPLQDSIAEIRVDVFQSDASYGDTSNGTIDLITKSGTNQFHGAPTARQLQLPHLPALLRPSGRGRQPELIHPERLLLWRARQATVPIRGLQRHQPHRVRRTQRDAILWFSRQDHQPAKHSACPSAGTASDFLEAQTMWRRGRLIATWSFVASRGLHRSMNSLPVHLLVILRVSGGSAFPLCPGAGVEGSAVCSRSQSRYFSLVALNCDRCHIQIS